MQAITETSDGSTITLAVGQMVELRLKENPTTGFRWRLQRDGAPACRIVSDALEPPAAEGPPVPGRGGTHVWHIQAVQVGLCDLALTYERGWQPDPAAVTFSVHLHVAG
jgi:inhibitor of cysteine peptidase